MVIGVVAALKEEIKPLIEAMEDVRVSKWGKRSLYEGEIGTCRVVALRGGIGKVKAAAATQYLIDRFAPEGVICPGVAGAINPRLTVGDIVVSRRALQHDFALGEARLLNKLRKRWLKADKKLAKLALEAGEDLGFEGRIHLGSVLTGDQAIVTQEKRQWLWDMFGGDCVDMESAAVAQVCQLNRVPFLIMRGISDSAEEEAVTEFKRSFAQSACDVARLTRGVLERIRLA